MAGLIVHPPCGKQIPDDLYLCPHCARVVDHDAAADYTVTPPEPQRQATPVPSSTCHHCNAALAPTAEVCDSCGTARAEAPAAATGRSVVLRLPSGVEIVVAQDTTVVLGRQVDDPNVNTAFVPYTAVSRRHVELWLTADELSARDLGSTNGTYLDGVRATPVATVRSDRPSVLGLGTEVQITVTPLTPGDPA